MDKDAEMMIKMAADIASLNSYVKQVIQDHERRLSELEKKKDSLKDTLIAWLVKGLIISLAVVASLTGAAGLVAKIMNIGS